MAKTVSRSALLARELVGQVARGELRPGDAIDLPALGRRHGVSRTVVREALADLGGKGLVVARPKVGTTIAPESQWNLLDPALVAVAIAQPGPESMLAEAIELRRVVEPALAAGAARDAGRTQQAAVLEAVRAIAGAVGRADAEAFEAADAALHAAIADACTNRLLRSIDHALSPVRAFQRQRLVAAQLEGGLAGPEVLQVLGMQTGLGLAIAKRDAAGAAAWALELATVARPLAGEAGAPDARRASSGRAARRLGAAGLPGRRGLARDRDAGARARGLRAAAPRHPRADRGGRPHRRAGAGRRVRARRAVAVDPALSTPRGPGVDGRAPRAGALLAVLATITIVSQFHRSSLSVIAPELTRELSPTPQALGLAGGMFFAVLAVVQIPVGVLLDWIGPRRLVASLTAVAVLGSLATAAASSGPGLVVARALVGLGCAAHFMAAVVISSRCFAGERLGTMLSRVFALSQIGNLLAGWPLAVLADSAGWRSAFVLAAIATAAAGAAFWRTLDERIVPARGAESLASVLRGVGEVFRTPGLVPILGIHTVAYAVVATVLGLWAGPYLHDVHGLDAADRGRVLAAMAVAQVVGVLVCGPLDVRLNTRKGVVLGGGLATLATLAVLAAWSSPPTAAAIALLVVLCAVSSYSVTIVAHGRTLFADRLLGRAITTLNLAQVIGASVMPIATGAVAAALAGGTSGGSPESAYRAIFALVAAGLATGLAVYSRSSDAPPRPRAA